MTILTCDLHPLLLTGVTLVCVAAELNPGIVHGLYQGLVRLQRRLCHFRVSKMNIDMQTKHLRDSNKTVIYLLRVLLHRMSQEREKGLPCRLECIADAMYK